MTPKHANHKKERDMRTDARRGEPGAGAGSLAASVVQGRPALAQRQGKVLGLALHFYPSTLDPAVGVAGPHYRVFVNTYEGLVGYERGTTKLVPALAESWSASSDLTAYT